MRKNAKIFTENIGWLFSLFTSFLINLLAFLSRKIYRLDHLNFYSSTTSIHMCKEISNSVHIQNIYKFTISTFFRSISSTVLLDDFFSQILVEAHVHPNYIYKQLYSNVLANNLIANTIYGITYILTR